MNFRQVSPEEIPREASQGVVVPTESLMLGGFDEQGNLAAVVGLMTLVHLESFWIREDLRDEKVSIGKKLWRNLQGMMGLLGVDAVFAFAPQPGVVKVLDGIGGERLPFPVYRVRKEG